MKTHLKKEFDHLASLISDYIARVQIGTLAENWEEWTEEMDDITRRLRRLQVIVATVEERELRRIMSLEEDERLRTVRDD